MSLRIAFAGGGTGGHLYPAVALARALKELTDTEVVFLGSAKPLERRILDPTGFRHVALPSAPWRGARRPLAALRFAWEQTRGVLAARRELEEFKPDALVGLGGFPSVPGVLAAKLRGVPVALFEPNAVAGRANQYLARLADEAYVHWEATELACPLVQSGTPLGPRALAPGRSPERARAELGLPVGRPVVLVMGGSQGAAAINRWITRDLRSLGAAHRVSFVHLAGNAEAAAELEAAYAHAGCAAKVVAFLDDIGLAYRAADVAIVRAGGATLAELLAVHLPAFVIPLPRSAGDHQRLNAIAFAETGAGEVVEQGQLTPRAFERVLGLATDPARVALRRAAARTAARPNAAVEAAQRLIRLAGGKPTQDISRHPHTQTRAA